MSEAMIRCKQGEHFTHSVLQKTKTVSTSTSVSVLPLGLVNHVPVADLCLQWEDPIRTAGSYLGALTLLFGAHYLPLTQTALKAGVTTLGSMQTSASMSLELHGTNPFCQLCL